MERIKNLGYVLVGLFVSILPSSAAMTLPNINIGLTNANTPQDFTNGLQILIWLTILLAMSASFIGMSEEMAVTLIPLSVLLMVGVVVFYTLKIWWIGRGL